MTETNETAINIKHKKIMTVNGLYYVAIILLTVKTILTSSQLIILNETIDNIIFISCIIFIMLKMILFFRSFRYLLITVGIGFICLYTCVKTGSYHIFTSYLIIAGSFKVNKRTMVKCIAYTSGILISIHVAIYLLNLSFGTIESSAIVKQGIFVSTNSFYLGHSNTASMYILWTLLAFIYLNYEKLSFNKIVIYLLIMGMNYYFTKSRTGLIVSIVAILMIYFDKYVLDKNNKIFKRIAKYGFTILSIIACLLCIFYNSTQYMQLMDKIFTGRLLLGSFAYKTFGYTLFGQFIDFNQNYGVLSNWSVTRLAIDIMPLRLLINYGIFYLLLYNFMLLKINKYTSRIENILISLMVLHSCMEIFTINAIVCFPLSIVGWYMLNEKYLNK